MTILAHPDDAEFGCGGTLATWAKQGAEITMVIVTDGSKGNADRTAMPAFNMLALMLAVFTVSIGYGVVLVDAWRKHRRGSAPDLTTAAMLLFMPIATLSLVMTAKSGSSSSYYMQWDAGLAVFGAVGVAWLVQAASQQLANGSPLRAAGWAAIALALASWTLYFPDRSHLAWLGAMKKEDPRVVELLEPVKGEIISDEMAILMRMHRNVVWEPAIFAELAHKGRWDERLVIEQLRNHRIGAVVTYGKRGDRWFDERYNPAVADAIDAALPRKIIVGGRVVHLPPAPSAPVIRETPSAAAGQR